MNGIIDIRKPLEWDSEFFGMRIASVRCVEPFDPERLKHLVEGLREEGYALLYLFIEEDERPAPALPLGDACRLADVKYVFATDDLHAAADPDGVEEFSGEADELLALAFEAGTHSRFRQDERFGEGTFERFYRTWVENSLARRIADHVLVCRDGERTSGFATLRIEGLNASVGLIAVRADARGRGTGRRLVDACKRIAARSGARTLTVATQQANEGACAFYRRCGFRLSTRTAVYHCWLHPKERTI